MPQLEMYCLRHEWHECHWIMIILVWWRFKVEPLYSVASPHCAHPKMKLRVNQGRVIVLFSTQVCVYTISRCFFACNKGHRRYYRNKMCFTRSFWEYRLPAMTRNLLLCLELFQTASHLSMLVGVTKWVLPTQKGHQVLISLFESKSTYIYWIWKFCIDPLNEKQSNYLFYHQAHFYLEVFDLVCCLASFLHHQRGLLLVLLHNIIHFYYICTWETRYILEVFVIYRYRLALHICTYIVT